MKRIILNIIYVVVLVVNLIAVYIDNETLRFITKPLLMPLLVLFFISSTQAFASPLKKWIISALMFSWVGDVLLMFESGSSNYFIFGLIAFLIAHIFYIVFYESLARQEKVKRNHWLSLLVLIYYIFLIWFLTPYLGDMKWPVWIYGLVISCMLMQALHTAKINNRSAAQWMIIGAILFIASDTVLAINKFYKPFTFAGIAIMLIYGLAQLLITLGAKRYISSASKQ